jgi:hypothetical protein
MAYCIFQKLEKEDIELLRDPNKFQDIKKDDLWSMNKLQATCFLNADQDIRQLALRENAAGKISSEAEMNSYCAKQIVSRLLDCIADENKIKKARITVDVTKKVQILRIGAPLTKN